MIYKILYKLSTFKISDKLGGNDTYPVPFWFTWLARQRKWTPTQQMLRYSRMVDGRDLSFLAPDELGCAESVSRIWNTLFGLPVFTSTIQMFAYMKNSGNFEELPKPVDGCITIAVTDFRDGVTIHGHTGVSDKDGLWNNTSRYGKWLYNWTQEGFKRYFHEIRKLSVHHFIIRSRVY